MKTYLLGFSALLSLWPALAIAQQVQETVTVTGRLEESQPQELARYGSRLTTVTGETIQNKVYDDATQALQFEVPGLSVVQYEGPFGYSYQSLQGSRPNDILYLIDGVRINNRLYPTTLPLDTIPAHMIDHIEVLEGGEALFYGTQAQAGVINIVTRPFTDNQYGMFGGGYQTNDGYNIYGFFSDSIGAHKFVVYGSEDRAEGFQPYRDEDYQPSSTDRTRSYNVLTLGGKYAFEPSDRMRFSLSYQHTDAQLDISRPIRLAESYNKKKEDILSAKLDWTVSDAVALYVKGYYHNWDASVTEFDNDITTPGNIINAGIDVPWGFRDYGANVLGRFKVSPGVEAYAGYDLQIYSGRDDFYYTKPTSETVNAFFGQVRLTDALIPHFHGAAGLRYNSPDGGQSSTVWNVSGQYDLTDNLFLRTNLGTAFRLPSASELFVNYSEPGYNEVGNPNLRPETSFNVNGSIGGNFPLGGMSALHVEIVGFYRNIEDLIDYIEDPSDPSGDTYTLENSVGEVHVRGFELIGSLALNNDWSLAGSYTHTTAEVEGTNLQIERIPESTAQASIDWSPMNMPFGASLSLNYTGEVHRTQASTDVSYGDYAVVDFAAHYFLDQERKHRLKLRVANIFDKEYGMPLGTVSDTGVDYVALSLGEPRTLHISYDFSF